MDRYFSIDRERGWEEKKEKQKKKKENNDRITPIPVHALLFPLNSFDRRLTRVVFPQNWFDTLLFRKTSDSISNYFRLFGLTIRSLACVLTYREKRILLVTI